MSEVDDDALDTALGPESRKGRRGGGKHAGGERTEAEEEEEAGEMVAAARERNRGNARTRGTERQGGGLGCNV